MKQPPKGIEEKTNLQIIFQFFDPLECFQTFRYVSKSWKDSVETCRYDKCEDLWSFLYERPSLTPVTIFVVKILKVLKSVDVYFEGPNSFLHKSDVILSYLPYLRSLNEIKITDYFNKCSNSRVLGQRVRKFQHSLLQNFNRSLKTITLSCLDLPPNITFPKLKVIKFDSMITSIQKLDELVSNRNELTPSLKVIQMRYIYFNQELASHIANNYKENCVYGVDVHGKNFMQRRLPIQISKWQKCETIQDWKFPERIQYLVFKLDLDWRKFCGKFDLLPNLKGIRMMYQKRSVLEISKCTLRFLSEDDINILKFCIQSRGIQLLNAKEFRQKIVELSNNVPFTFRL